MKIETDGQQCNLVAETPEDQMFLLNLQKAIDKYLDELIYEPSNE